MLSKKFVELIEINVQHEKTLYFSRAATGSKNDHAASRNVSADIERRRYGSRKRRAGATEPDGGWRQRAWGSLSVERNRLGLFVCARAGGGGENAKRYHV